MSYSNTIGQSIKSSVAQNGVWSTILLIVQYLRFKRSKEKLVQLKIPKSNDPVYLRPATSDFSVFRQIFMNNEYGFALEKTPEIIVDGGANIGLATLYFKGRFPGATIIALEPDESNFEMLALNTHEHSAIIALPYALWRENAFVEMVEGSFDKWGLQVRAAKESKNSIRAVSMKYLIDHYKLRQIDLLKIDIEGAEYELFQAGMEEWLPKVKILVIELHEHLRPGCTDLFTKALNIIPHRLSQSGENIIVYNLNLL